MAACSGEHRRIQSVITLQGGPYVNRREAEAAIAAALRLCVSSSAAPCTGDCVVRGTPCEAHVEEWDPAIGPFYSAPVGGSGWYFRIPVGTWITFRYLPAYIPRVMTVTAPVQGL